MKKAIVTGAAGFIGYHVSKKLLESGFNVTGIDNLNNYYDVSLKVDRKSVLSGYPKFKFVQVDIAQSAIIQDLFEIAEDSIVIHLAAQAGVRYSLENPHSYVNSNLTGFVNILELCRQARVKHLIYASSSSVYGSNNKVPFSVEDPVERPMSLYAATKRANELLAYSYSHLYSIPCTGLRFFTVYGPWGRPDMAYFSFTKNIFEEKAINVFNKGLLYRDFTYIDDIVDSVIRLIDKSPNNIPPYKIYNIGNNKPVSLGAFIEILEVLIGKKALKNYLPMQPGDMLRTYADIDPLVNEIEFQPRTSLEEGLGHFIDWYKIYYNLN